MLQPSILGDFATYTFFSIAGVFVGGGIGALSGAAAAKRTIRRFRRPKRELRKPFVDLELMCCGRKPIC